ncbi:MAG: hypothetical protein LBT27_03370 [Prevotellaceae bacterium]|jgi:hypothetical protein|nr:hypothetical protein [Prevotellaceae bacterium]
MIHIADISEPTIFTTGAFLRPMKVKDIEGKDFWIWTVARFEDDSFYDGEVYNPVEVANSLEKLLFDTTAEILN